MTPALPTCLPTSREEQIKSDLMPRSRLPPCGPLMH